MGDVTGEKKILYDRKEGNMQKKGTEIVTKKRRVNCKKKNTEWMHL
jgi:hypothetical protein